jgi:hypothetical protein
MAQCPPSHEHVQWPTPTERVARCVLQVCTATYRAPAASSADAGLNFKFSSGHISLQYGTRASYIRGLDDLIAKPVLTMAQVGQQSTLSPAAPPSAAPSAPQPFPALGRPSSCSARAPVTGV